MAFTFCELRDLVIAMAEIAEDAVGRNSGEHEALHRGALWPPVRPIPFQDRHIPDLMIVEMLERMDEERLDLEAIAAAYDLPLRLVEREIALYERWYRGYVLGITPRSAS